MYKFREALTIYHSDINATTLSTASALQLQYDYNP